MTIIQEATPQSTTTTIPALEDRQIDMPDELLGQSPYLGGPGFPGTIDSAGVPELEGYYWSVDTGGPTRSAPVVLGNTVIVGGGDGSVWAIGTDGSIQNRFPMAGPIEAPIAIGEVKLGGVGSDGTTRAFIAADVTGSVVARWASGQEIWTADVGERVTTTPIITGDAVVVAAASGRLYGLSPGEGDIVWRYPGEDQTEIGEVAVSPVHADGVVYVAGDNVVVAIDAATGTELCTASSSDVGSAPGTIAGGYVYSPTGASIHIMSERECQFRTSGGVATVPMNVQTITSPAIDGDNLYVGSGQLFTASSVVDGTATFSSVDLGSQVSSSPVIADGIIYVGTAGGTLFALDQTDGTVLWRFDTGTAIDAPVAVIDDAVFLFTGDGRLIALGG